ncbi:hypothetical protein D3C76_1265540 [compost metagenome]
MVGNEFDLLREQSRVDGMQDGAHARHPEIQFHVPVAIPGQRSDPVAGLHIQSGQGIGQLFGASADIGIAAVMHRSFGGARGDLALWVRLQRMFQDRGNQQGLILH